MARIIFAASGGQEWGSKIFEEWSRQFSITNERASRTWALMVNQPPTRSGGAIALFSKATNDYGWKGEWVFPNAPKVDDVTTGMIARMIQTQEQVPEKVGQQNALMSDEQGQVPFPPPIGEGIIAMAKHRASLMEPNVRELAANQRVLQYLTEVDDYPAGLVRYRKPPRMLVKEFLVEGGITIIYGPPKTGKTLVSLELAYCVVTGTDFFGRRIKEPAGVLYISAEGAELNSRRFQARTFKPDGTFESLPFLHLSASGLATADGMHVLEGLTNVASDYLKRSTQSKLGLIVIDTAAAGLSIDDENDNTLVSRVLKNIEDIICVRHGVAVLLVHHSGKSEQAGPRGASAYAASAFTTACTTKIGRAMFSLSIEKNRIGESDYLFGTYTIKAKDFGTGEDGEPATVAYIEMSAAQTLLPKASKGRPPKGSDAMGRAFIAASSTKAQDWHVAGDPNAPLVRAVSYEDLLDAYMPLADYNDGDDANQRRAAQKTLNKAIEASAGEYKHYGNGKSKMVWRPNDIQTGGVLSGLDFSNVTNH